MGDYVDSSLGKMLDAKKNKGELHPYLGNSNVRWGQIDLRNLAEMRFEEHEQERYQLLPGDLVVCEGGEPGRCAIWRDQIPGMKIQKALHRVRAKPGLKNEYLYYWLTLAARLGTLEPYFTGTTIKHLTGRALAELPVPLPPIKVQESIVAILGKVDERIDNLAQTNATLEAIAQALFKSWFVDFDPVRAKAEGREPEGMDAVTAALFPSEFEDSETGSIPKGWSARALNEALEINPQRVLKRGSVAPYLDMASIPTVGCVPMVPIQREFSSGSKFINGDTLLARITPCLENGKTAYVSCLENGQVGWGSTEFTVLRPHSPLPSFFAYLLARRVDFRAHAIQSMSGTSGRQRVEIARLQGYFVTIPNEAVADAFAATVEPIERKIFANAKHADCLAEIRDTILPRLISGKLRLPEAEREVEAATA